MTAWDVELPAAYVDGVVEDTDATRPLLANRFPEPDEVAAPRGAVISFDVFETGGSSVSLAATKAWVDGVLAFDGGTFQTGFTGPSSAHSTPFSDVLRVAIDATADFPSESTKTVRVVSATVDGAALDVTWEFVVEDYEPPTIDAVDAISGRVVRVRFSEAMTVGTLTTEGGPLNPATWELVATTVPAVVPDVSSIAEVDSSTFDVTFSDDLTPGAGYTLFAEGALDASGNELDLPAAAFLGFSPPAPEGRDFDLWTLAIPYFNRAEDAATGDLRRFVACLQDPVNVLLGSVDRFVEVLDPDRAPEEFVDAMLLDLGNPFDFELSLVDKRRLAQLLVAIYQQKGTEPGIAGVVRLFLGIDVAVDAYNGDDAMELGDAELGEDFELGPGTSALRYSFTVVVPRVLEDSERAMLVEIVEYMKPAHTHFVALVEPEVPVILDHLELGYSELGDTWVLH